MKMRTYALLKRTEFPDGTKCAVVGCPNSIAPGKPYDEVVLTKEDDLVTVQIVCVYH